MNNQNKQIPEHEFSTYGKGFYVCCPKCNKSSWMQSKVVNCGRCGHNEIEIIPAPKVLYKCGS